MSDVHVPGEVTFEQRAVVVQGEFIPEYRLNGGEIRAGVASGELQPWRLDATGTLWYRRVQAGAATLAPIHGVPVADTEEADNSCEMIEGSDDE